MLGAALHDLQARQTRLDDFKARRKATPKHVELKDLPPEQRVAQLRGGRKHFIDTIKLIAYRAETALVQLARETLRRHDDARSFVRGLFASSVNLRPDPARSEMRVEIHGQANPIHDATLEVMCRELNETEILYPGTDLRLVYRPIRSSVFPRGQDVCRAKRNLESENEYVEVIETIHSETFCMNPAGSQSRPGSTWHLAAACLSETGQSERVIPHAGNEV